MIDSPIPAMLNQHAEAAVAHLSAWVAAQGLVTRSAAADRFERADFARFAAATYPRTGETGLCVIADWFAWLFLLDDQFDDGLVGLEPERVQRVMGDILTILTTDGTTAPALSDDAPALVTALADLWRRTAPYASAQWWKRFADHAAAGAAGAFWEAGNRASGTIPAVDVYIEQRRHTGAIYVCMDLIEVVDRIVVPEDVYQSETFQAALGAACDVVCWTNDVYSLEKETSLGEYHNLVAIVAQHDGLSLDDATRDVVERINARTQEFIELEPSVLKENPDYAGALDAYLAGMRSWMRGNLDWSRRTHRYSDSVESGYLERLAERDEGPAT